MGGGGGCVVGGFSHQGWWLEWEWHSAMSVIILN